tara:strand:+ start:198 stop:314 length:117 start_codon:yes stop_codon:yes gene_type:complete
MISLDAVKNNKSIDDMIAKNNIKPIKSEINIEKNITPR